MNKFDKTAIVIIDTQKGDSAHETHYVTFGVLGNTSKEELEEEALRFINIDAKKSIRQILVCDSEKYRKYLESELADFVQE